MRLDVLNRIPGQQTAGSLRKSNVEELVMALEGRVIVPTSGLILKVDKLADPFSALWVER